MSVPPESIQAGQCYLTETGQVRRVLTLLPGSRVQYEWRNGMAMPKRWKMDAQALHSFAVLVERPIPCDWTPETDE